MRSALDSPRAWSVSLGMGAEELEQQCVVGLDLCPRKEQLAQSRVQPRPSCAEDEGRNTVEWSAASTCAMAPPVGMSDQMHPVETQVKDAGVISRPAAPERRPPVRAC
jgi:hypothetical protein